MATKFIRFSNNNDLRSKLWDLEVGSVVCYGRKSNNSGRDWYESASITSQESVDFFISNGRKFIFSSESYGNTINSKKGFGRVVEINSRGFRIEIL